MAIVKTKSGAFFRWSVSEIVLFPVVADERSDGGSKEFRSAAIRAANSWNTALDGCAAPRLLIGATSSANLRAVEDRKNLLVAVRGDWCPGGSVRGEYCAGEERKAITRLRTGDGRLEDGDGVLIEVDVEVNLSRGSGVGDSEIEPLLLHEFGHVLGLGHSCSAGDACLEKAARASVMYPAPLEAGRERMTRPDEESVGAICSIYDRPRRYEGLFPALFAGPLIVAFAVFMSRRKRRGI